jgi:hypothetical protein
MSAAGNGNADCKNSGADDRQSGRAGIHRQDCGWKTGGGLVLVCIRERAKAAKDADKIEQQALSKLQRKISQLKIGNKNHENKLCGYFVRRGQKH